MAMRNRRVVCGFLWVFLLSPFVAASLSGQEKEISTVSAFLAGKASAAKQKAVAVVDFTDLDGNVTRLGRFLAEEVSVGLNGHATTFVVVDRTHLKAILQEHKLASTGVIDPLTARKLGEIAGVTALVTGSMTPLGDSVRLSVKLLDTATAVMLGSTVLDVPRTKAIDDLLGQELTGQMNTTSARAPTAPRTSARPAGGVAQRQEGCGVSFDLAGCRRSGSNVTCHVVFTALDQDVTFVLRDAAEMWDDRGNQLETQGRSTLGNRGFSLFHPHELVKGVATPAVFYYSGLDDAATSLAKFAFYLWASNGGCPVAFRDIALR